VEAHYKIYQIRGASELVRYICRYQNKRRLKMEAIYMFSKRGASKKWRRIYKISK
jgi:hypothetical protein